MPAPAPDFFRVSMRALPSKPEYVEKFKYRLENERGLGRVTVCQIAVSDEALLEQRLLARDPNIDPADLATRLLSNQTQPDIAAAFCRNGRNDGMTFVNDYPTIVEAGAALLDQLNAHLAANE